MQLSLLRPLLGAFVAACAFIGQPATAAPSTSNSRDTLQSLNPRAALPGTISLVADSPALTFRYSTPDAFSTNWIGLYKASGGGPEQEKMDQPSLVWAYAPAASGTVRLSPDTLQAGTQYKAFFLARDGYKWLADPILVSLPPTPASFPVAAATLRNARQGDSYTADLAGLVLGGGSSNTFSKVSGPAWLSVSPAGVVTGTPPNDSGSIASLTVQVTNARLTVSIPIRPAGQPLVPQLRILTYNLWHGGAQVNDYHAKQVRFLLNANVDIVSLQEASSGDHVKRLAAALGWYSWQSKNSVGILSRYPIAQVYPELSNSGGVRITLDSSASSSSAQQINLWAAHLGYTPYGPYDFCFDHMTVSRVIGERESSSGRTGQITDTLAAMSSQLDPASSDTTPVLLLGDFNAPSHLDYTSAAASLHCGYSNVAWPSSVLPEKVGLIDSFRVANPDPVAVPGNTWSPLYPLHEGDKGVVEPQDRIDFVYHKGGKLKVVESKTVLVGEPKPFPGQKENEWTSDHRAVLTVYQVG